MKIENLQELQQVIELMAKLQVDFLEVDGIKIQKSIHNQATEPSKSEPVLTDEDYLFYSSN